VRRALRLLSTVLLVTGALLLIDAGVTLAWQEPVSALYARVNQDALAGDLDRLERVAPTPVETRALRALPDTGRRTAFLARALRRSARPGQAIARLAIPAIDLDSVVVHGTRPGDLRKGPGLYEQTPLPGAGGTTAIAGHRTTYMAPFRRLDRLRKGDAVTVTMPYGRFSYRVERTRIVRPTELSVIRRVSHDRLVLSACHPLYSAEQRIIVFARLEDVRPRGSALRLKR
jgi:sortase A